MTIKKISIVAFIILLFSATTLAAAQQSAPKQKVIFFPDCDTIDYLEAFVNNHFVIPEGSSCKEPIVLELPEPKKEPMSFAQKKALGLKSAFNSRAWGFGGITAKKMRNANNNAAFLSDANHSFEGVELLYRYGASQEYISGLGEQFEQAKEFFDVNASLRFVSESDIGIASVDTQKNTNVITVAFYESVAGTSLELEDLRTMILYHEFGHAYVLKNFGDYMDVELSFRETIEVKPFDEYAANVYAQKLLPEEKAEMFSQGVKRHLEEGTVYGISRGLAKGNFGDILFMKANAQKFGITDLESNINEALEYETPAYRQKFNEIVYYFLERAETLSKENYEETMRALAYKTRELNTIKQEGGNQWREQNFMQ